LAPISQLRRGAPHEVGKDYAGLAIDDDVTHIVAPGFAGYIGSDISLPTGV
jgi:hypothetical protein